MAIILINLGYVFHYLYVHFDKAWNPVEDISNGKNNTYIPNVYVMDGLPAYQYSLPTIRWGNRE